MQRFPEWFDSEGLLRHRVDVVVRRTPEERLTKLRKAIVESARKSAECGTMSVPPTTYDVLLPFAPSADEVLVMNYELAGRGLELVYYSSSADGPGALHAALVSRGKMSPQISH